MNIRGYIDKLSPEAQQIIGAVLADLKYTPSPRSLRRLIQATRRKKLVFDARTLNPGITGFCVALADVDLIRLCDKNDEYLNQISEIHEMMHFILKHLPKVSLDLTYDAFLSLSPKELSILYGTSALVCRGLYDEDVSKTQSGFNNPIEFETEISTTIVISFIESQKSAPPDFTKDIYGY